jgi:mono/diheme cytochrome c family protein
MNWQMIRTLRVVAAAAWFLLPSVALAQITQYQQEQWLDTPVIVSHVDGVTGHPHGAVERYRRYCVGCHGELGDGNGEVAQWLDPPMWPKPRDFQLAVFKCRSTPTGTLPTDEDLFDTIARGLDRSAMPPWNTFTKQMRADLVAWIKHYSPRWQTEKPGTPITIPPEPEITPRESRRDRKFSPGCNAGNATALPVRPTGRRLRPLPTIKTGRFFRITSQTEVVQSAAAQIATCTRFS